MVTNAVNNQNEQKYQNAGLWKTTAAVIAGGTVAGLVKKPCKYTNPKLMAIMGEVNKLTEDEFLKATKGIEATLVETGLADKGVRLVRAGARNVDEILEIVMADLNARIITSYLPGARKNRLSYGTANNVKAGKNAFYGFKTKKVVIPEKGLLLGAFQWDMLPTLI